MERKRTWVDGAKLASSDASWGLSCKRSLVSGVLGVKSRPAGIQQTGRKGIVVQKRCIPISQACFQASYTHQHAKRYRTPIPLASAPAKPTHDLNTSYVAVQQSAQQGTQETKPILNANPIPISTSDTQYTRRGLPARLGLLLRGPNMRIMHLRRKLQARDGFLQMRLQRRDHDEHERLAVSSERVLQEVRELQPVSFYIHISQ